jgi:predicted glycosyltransferase
MNDVFRFWFDLENAPDVLFFEPIAEQFRQLGHVVLTTIRDYADVPELSKLYRVHGESIGWYGGKTKFGKIAAGLIRSCLLAKWARKKNIDFAIGFGSRPLALACWWLSIPNATVDDYEHSSLSAMNRFCNWIFFPEYVSTEHLLKRGIPRHKLIKYPGLKEDVYVHDHMPNYECLKDIASSDHDIIVLLRPPATLAHYHDESSEIIFHAILRRIAADPSVLAIFLRRDCDPTFDGFLRFDNIKQLPFPVKGLDLVANADLVISGGGTMIREAACLGIPAYSTFTGELAAVDKKLSEQGRLTLIHRAEEVNRIKFSKCKKAIKKKQNTASTLKFFSDKFLDLAARHSPSNQNTT